MSTCDRITAETRRVKAVALLAQKLSVADVARIVGVSRISVYRWKQAQASGKGLARSKATGRPCRLTGEQLRQVYLLWDTRDKWTTASFAEAIHVLTGTRYHPDHVGRLLHRMGLRPVRARKTLGPIFEVPA